VHVGHRKHDGSGVAPHHAVGTGISSLVFRSGLNEPNFAITEA